MQQLQGQKQNGESGETTGHHPERETHWDGSSWYLTGLGK